MTGPQDRTDQGTIARVYDQQATSEYERLDRSLLHRVEFVLTAELLDEFVAPGAEVLDAGAGPGRYAEYLLGRGCRVGLTDLSAESLRLFEQRVEPGLADGVLPTTSVARRCRKPGACCALEASSWLRTSRRTGP